MAESPTSVITEAISQTAVKVLWFDSVDGVAYHVFSGITDEFSEASLIGAAGAGIEEFAVYGLSAGIEYNFWVLAIDADGSQSDPEGPSAASTFSLLPVPGEFYAQGKSSVSIVAFWDDVENADWYEIYVNTTDVFEEATLGAMISQGVGYGSVDGLIASTGYYVWVKSNSSDLNGTRTEYIKVILPDEISGALDIDGIKTAIWFWASGVIAALGLDDSVIWANQNGTRPQSEHVQLGLAGPIMIGAYDSISPVNDSTQSFAQRGLRSFLISVNVYSQTDAVSVAAKMQSSLCNPVLKTPLVDSQLGVGKISDVRDLSAVLDTQWEQRAQFDFVIFASMREEFTQGTIERIQIQHVIPGID